MTERGRGRPLLASSCSLCRPVYGSGPRPGLPARPPALFFVSIGHRRPSALHRCDRPRPSHLWTLSPSIRSFCTRPATPVSQSLPASLIPTLTGLTPLLAAPFLPTTPELPHQARFPPELPIKASSAPAERPPARDRIPIPAALCSPLPGHSCPSACSCLRPGGRGQRTLKSLNVSLKASLPSAAGEITLHLPCPPTPPFSSLT